MSYINLNRVINSIADEQGIEVGSWNWLLGGVAAYSGSTGEHSSYGWRHHHKLNRIYARSVIANYGHRRTYYQNALVRGRGYEMGGRPLNWEPELPGDLDNGMVVYMTSTGIKFVSGPETEHFNLGPLYALIDDGGEIEIQALGKKFSASLVAEVLTKLQVNSLIGQVRETPNTIFNGHFGDRGNCNIVWTIVQSALRGCLTDPYDVKSGNDFVDLIIKYYETTPGISLDPKGTPREGLVQVRTYNSFYWLIPVFYDLWTHLPTKDPRKSRVWTIIRRWCQWAQDLEETVPGQAFNISTFYLPKEEFMNVPEPVQTIKPLLQKSNIIFDEKLNWEHRGFRACSVAAKILATPELQKAESDLIAKYPNGNKVWLVNADMEYVI